MLSTPLIRLVCLGQVPDQAGQIAEMPVLALGQAIAWTRFRMAHIIMGPTAVTFDTPKMDIPGVTVPPSLGANNIISF
jgi:hypothetical protein